MAEATDIAREILSQIRDGVATTNGRLDETSQRLESVVQRLEHAENVGSERMRGVETALLDSAEAQCLVAPGLLRVGERRDRLERELDELRLRVDAIESRLV